jgi:type IV secretory pathway VirB10-like protein
MDSYTITIAPNDDSGATTTLVVDTSGEQVRITDMHLHAAGGIAGGTMPTVDFGLLLRAVGAAPSAQPSIETAPADVPALAETVVPPVDAVDAPAAAAAEEPAPVKASRPRRAKRTPAAAPVAEAAPPRTRRARAAKAAAKAAAPREAGTGRRRRSAAAAPATATEETAPTRKATAKKAGTTAAGGGRQYRRMPEDFASVYQQTSSASALAEHYGVPRHTAQGWIRRVKASS